MNKKERQEAKNFREECQLAHVERNTELANYHYGTTYITIESSKVHECMLKTIW